MSYAPITARPESDARVDSADVTAMDLAGRGPLLLLIGSGLAWLLISGVFGLITSIQLHSPQFLSAYSWLTHGRAEAMRETAFVYGWAANAGLAIALWVLGRLGGNPLRGLNWAFIGAGFWNIGLTAGIIGIATGYMTSFSLFQLPRFIQPLMVVAYCAVAVPGVLAWMGRRTSITFAAQWYAVAALFLFPWLSSLAQLVLLWSPMRGVAQSVGASWYAQGVTSVWLAPLALAAAYYLVPKVSGRVLPTYDFARLGFWTLIAIGSWAGARTLIGGPVPAWIATTSIVATVVLLIHYVIVLLNLRVVWGVRGTTASFVRFGLVAYVFAGVLDAITSFRGVAVSTQFTFFASAIQQLGLYGGVSMMFFAAIYYMVPRLTGTAWDSMGLTIGHRVLAPLAFVGFAVALSVAGWTQGDDLLAPKTTFGDIFDHVRLPLLLASGAQLALLAANMLLMVNFVQTIRHAVLADVVALNPVRSSGEVSAT